jgi:hypothetical protein
MKLPIPPPDNDDGNEPPVDPPRHPDDDGDHEHRRDERKAVFDALTAYLLKPDPATLAKIRLRWETGILNQMHKDKWGSIWPVLDVARRVPGFCFSGVVIFGLRCNGQQSVDLSMLTEPPKELLDVLGDFRVYAITLELVADLNDAAKKGVQCEYDKRYLRFLEWLETHRRYFPFLSDAPVHKIANAEVIAITIAKQAVDELPPLILNLLVNLESSVFVFLPTLEDPAAGWRGFFEFANAYSRLPASTIRRFEDYLFEARSPSSSGA